MKIEPIYNFIEQKKGDELKIVSIETKVSYKNDQFIFYFSFLRNKTNKQLNLQAIKKNQEQIKIVGNVLKLKKISDLQDGIVCFINKYFIEY